MDKIFENFLRNLLDHEDNLRAYMESFYRDIYNDLGHLINDSKTSYIYDIYHILDVLEMECLVECDWIMKDMWSPDWLIVKRITFEGRHYFDSERPPRLAVLIDRISHLETLRCTHSHFGRDRRREIREKIVGYWYQEMRSLLLDIYKQTADSFIGELISDFDNIDVKTIIRVIDKFYSYDASETRTFSSIKSKLASIRNNVDRYYEKKRLPEESERGHTVKMNRKHKIFISHSSKDVVYVQFLVNLLEGMGLNQTQLFCSSLPGYGIPIDLNIYDYLRNQFLDYDLHILFIHSENYYKSPVCLNEMGAAWALKNSYTSILLPGFEYNQMVGVVNSQSISIKLDMRQLELQDKLNQFYDNIVAEFGLIRRADIIWQQQRDAFIMNCSRYYEMK